MPGPRPSTSGSLLRRRRSEPEYAHPDFDDDEPVIKKLRGRTNCGSIFCNKSISSRTTRSRSSVVYCDETCPEGRVYCNTQCRLNDQRHKCKTFQYDPLTKMTVASHVLERDTTFAKLTTVMEFPRIALVFNDNICTYKCVCVECCVEFEDDSDSIESTSGGMTNDGMLLTPESANDLRQFSSTSRRFVGLSQRHRCPKCKWPLCSDCRRGKRRQSHTLECNVLRQLPNANFGKSPIEDDAETAYILLALVRVYLMRNNTAAIAQLLKLVDDTKNLPLSAGGYDGWMFKRIMKNCSNYIEMIKIPEADGQDILKCLLLCKIDHFVGSKQVYVQDPNTEYIRLRYSYKILPIYFSFSCYPNILLQSSGDDVFILKTMRQIHPNEPLTLSIKSDYQEFFSMLSMSERRRGDLICDGDSLHRKCKCAFCTEPDQRMIETRNSLYGFKRRCERCRQLRFFWPRTCAPNGECYYNCSVCFAILPSPRTKEVFAKVDGKIKRLNQDIERSERLRNDNSWITWLGEMNVKLLQMETLPKYAQIRFHYQVLLAVFKNRIMCQRGKFSEEFIEQLIPVLKRFSNDMSKFESCMNNGTDLVTILQAIQSAGTLPIEIYLPSRTFQYRQNIITSARRLVKSILCQDSFNRRLSPMIDYLTTPTPPEPASASNVNVDVDQLHHDVQN